MYTAAISLLACPKVAQLLQVKGRKIHARLDL